jgi:CRP-like cAMP-binding protein
MNELKAFLNQIYEVEEEAMEAYLACWQTFELPKRSTMTTAGETERYMYYVVSGVQKSYFIHNNREHIIAFTYPPSFSGVPDSFFDQSPSPCFLETVSDSSFLRISFQQHETMINRYRSLETLFRKTVEQYLSGLLQRHYELMSLSVEERFRTFTKRSPHLFQLVPQKDLAAYLRIDPTNFSKLMGSIVI